jgi:hypothetical protein
VRESDSRYVIEDRRTVERHGIPFDRVGFAMRLLRLLRPSHLTVAVRESRWELRVERGRAWDRGPEDGWAVVSIPPHATREDIALALVQLAGAERDPFMLDLLLTSPEPH